MKSIFFHGLRDHALLGIRSTFSRSCRSFRYAGSVLRWSVLGLVATMSQAPVCNADEVKEPTAASAGVVNECESPSFALSSLQKSHAEDGNSFVIQGELDNLIHEGGGGACASAAGIDVLQTLRMMAGKNRLPHPHKAVLSSFRDQHELLNGRVTNEQFVRLIHFYESHLDGTKLDVNIESAPNSTHATDGVRWTEQSGPNLSVGPRQIKVVSYTVTEADGNVLGRHFVLLKEIKANVVTVVDPSSPVKDRRYLIDCKPGEGGGCKQVFLLNPPGTPVRNLTYEINTIFHVMLSAEDENNNLPTKQGVATLESIKTGINKTASDLRGTDDFLSPRLWREKTAAFGLPGLDLPTEYGGSAWPATKMIEVFKHAGRYNLNFRDVVGGAHVRPLLKSSNPQILEIVRQVASGKAYIAIAITEPEVGSDVSAIKSTSKKVEGGFLLTGTKRFNARLDQATHVIVFTQGTTGVPGKLSVFVLPINAPGLTVERLKAHGLTGNSYGGIAFKDLFVPESHLIGQDGEGLRIFFEHFLYWRLMQTAAALGTAENALEQMAERIKTRTAFGGPIGRFTHLQQPIGQHTTELQMAHALAREAAEMIDRGDYPEARGIICGLKAEGVEIALKAVDAATRAFGGEGYSNLVDLGDRLKDLNGLRIADGTTDVMRMEVVRQKFGREFWQMAVQDED